MAEKANVSFPFWQTAIPFMGLVHQPVRPAGAIEQRILGVQMEMNKVRVRHGDSLTSNRQDTKTQKYSTTNEHGLTRIKDRVGRQRPASALSPVLEVYFDGVKIN
jgi:hypothetical protein